MELEECVEDILKVFWEFAAEILMSLLEYCLKNDFYCCCKPDPSISEDFIYIYTVYTYARCPLDSTLVVQPSLSDV